MPNVNDLKTSKYLKKEDVDPPVVVTIKSYEQVNVGTDSQEELKWALSFNELPKPMVLNSTNGQLIANIVRNNYGVQNNAGDFDNWIGKKVELWNDPSVGFAGRITGGIRVRPAATANAQTNVQSVDSEDIPF